MNSNIMLIEYTGKYGNLVVMYVIVITSSGGVHVIYNGSHDAHETYDNYYDFQQDCISLARHNGYTINDNIDDIIFIHI